VPAQLFDTGDGYLALFVTTDGMWRRLCAGIDRAEWADDPRFATAHARFDNRVELLDLLGARLKEATAEEWETRLGPLGLAVGAVKELADALDGDLGRTRGMVVTVDTPDGPLRMVASPIRFGNSETEYRPPPRLHEHTDEVRHETLNADFLR
jgi:crotonobetainyl-CoA:carnitine CoA-transferase CaiB-like acyl-CoA transferase